MTTGSYIVEALRARFADESMPWSRAFIKSLIDQIAILTQQRDELSAARPTHETVERPAWQCCHEWSAARTLHQCLKGCGSTMSASTGMVTHPNAQKASVCICGEPNTQGVTHRTDGPCFVTPRAE